MTFDPTPATDPTPQPTAIVRPPAVTASGVILMAVGGLLTLLGLLFVLAAPGLADIADDPDFVTQLGYDPAVLQSFALTFGIMLGIFGAIQLVSGAFVMLLRSWARILGMICAVLGAMFSLLFVFSGEVAFGAVGLVIFASYAYAFWALTTRGVAFSGRRGSRSGAPSVRGS